MSEVSTVVQVIQTALAPAFLLSGVGAILAVLINRLSRVIDRFRILESCRDPSWLGSGQECPSHRTAFVRQQI
jgi:hypothetical protein